MSNEDFNKPYRYDTITIDAVSTAELCEAALFYDPVNEKYQPRPGAENNPLHQYFEFNRNPAPLRRVLNSVTSRWRAFAIREKPYLDLEFWDSHAGFYEHCFLRFPVACERYHFFSPYDTKDWERTAPDRIDSLLASFRRGDSGKEILKSFEYHGYCVLRPKHAFAVGRSALMFDERSADDLPKDAKDTLIPYEMKAKPFLEAGYRLRATLMNTRLPIHTVEFIQQDPNVGVCATASLWVATRITAQALGFNKYTYSTITRQAVRGWSPERRAEMTFDPIGVQDGLYPEQIRNALGATGANTLVVSASHDTGQAEMLHEIYSFCESGLPIILCFTADPTGVREGHAVTVVGHSLPAASMFDTPSTQQYPKPIFESLDSWRLFSEPLSKVKVDLTKHYVLSHAIRVYYAHDDGFGPFNRISFVQGVEDPQIQAQLRCRERLRKKFGAAAAPASGAVLLQRGGKDTPELNYLQHAIIPLPPNARLRAIDPLPDLITHFDLYYGNKAHDLSYVWRGFLTEGTLFKTSLTEREYDEKVRAWYASLHLPQFIWVYEVSCVAGNDWSELLAPPAGHPHRKRQIAGEFIFDATCPREEAHRAHLSSRMWGLCRDYRSKFKNLSASVPGLPTRDLFYGPHIRQAHGYSSS